MAQEPTFTVEQDGRRVVLVPEFWPSDLEANDRRKYDDLRSLHVVDDGALTMPAEYLPERSREPGRSVALDALWRARTDHLGSLGVGQYPAGALEGRDADRDRIASELLETHQDCYD